MKKSQLEVTKEKHLDLYSNEFFDETIYLFHRKLFYLQFVHLDIVFLVWQYC